MGSNVWRVLGIVVVSMVLCLAGLFLLLFTICGGFKEPDAAVFGIVTLGIVAGCVALIVWLGRGIAANRQNQLPAGLAVPPAAPAVQARAPLTGAELQWLIFLRIALAATILLSFGMMAFTFLRYQGAGYNPFLSFGWIFSTVIGVLPPALLLLLLRNPPQGLVVDLIAGMGIGSLLFRWGNFALFILPLLRRTSSEAAWVTMLPSMGLFTLADIAVVALAIQVRRSVDTTSPARIVATTAAFMVWEFILNQTWRFF